MKKLLLLGGSRYILPIIDAAKKLGIYTITCDYLPDNIAHKYSDEYCNVSVIDKEAVLEAAKRLNIDGVISFACDPGVITAAYVAEKLGLPSCGSYESVCILQNKDRFRKFLADNGFTVPVAKGYSDIEEAKKDAGLFNWPVIVKPTDSAGSKGVTKVETPDGLEESARHALTFSLSKHFVIEDFIEKKGFSSDSEGFSVDGELVFVSFSSQRFDVKAENPHTPSAYSWPASISAHSQRELTAEIRRLLKLLNMSTSMYNIETREGANGRSYIMEVSPRGGGNRLAEMLRYATGVDLLTNAVRAAVGLPVEGVTQKPYNGFWAEIILHSNSAGIFEGLWVAQEIRGNVIEEDLWILPGAAVKEFSAANDAIGTLVLKFDTQQRLQHVMDHQADYVRVLVK